MMNKDVFIKTLKEEALKINIMLDNEQLIKFYEYKELLLEWNDKMNLTAITEDYDIIIKHFIDCLQCTKYIKTDKNNINKIIDVGTGAGFPGIIIAIYFDDLINITLLDSLNKRLIFLEEVKNKLQLNNIYIVHKRAEEGAHEIKYRENFDYVVSRAVSYLNVLLECTVAYLKVGGECIFLKGDNVNEEIKESKNALNILKCKKIDVYKYLLNLNNEEFKRNILIIKKYSKTDEKYPRSYGKIKKLPL